MNTISHQLRRLLWEITIAPHCEDIAHEIVENHGRFVPHTIEQTFNTMIFFRHKINDSHENSLP